MDKNFRKKEMRFLQIPKIITILRDNFTSITRSRKREPNMVITPKMLLVLLGGMSGLYVLVLLIGDEKIIKETNSGLISLFYMMIILFGGLSLILIAIFGYYKIIDVKNKIKQIIKSPEDIKLLEQELQETDNPKTEHLLVKSLLRELLRRVKNIQEETIPENNKRISELEIKNQNLEEENKKLQKDIVEITSDLIQIKQSIHQNNGGV